MLPVAGFFLFKVVGNNHPLFFVPKSQIYLDSVKILSYILPVN